ncbi:MAG: hypothetical protein V1753_04510, partial [Pseudomonadota bacterium]
MQQAILTCEQYNDLTKQILHSVDACHRIVALNSLKHTKYFLKYPIHITLEVEGEKVIASFEDIEAFAYADTESEAMELLCEEIAELYEELL